MLGRTRQERLRNYLEQHSYEVLLGGWEAEKIAGNLMER
jgi:hypothetical protein